MFCLSPMFRGLLVTMPGDLEIELWATETPKAGTCLRMSPLSGSFLHNISILLCQVWMWVCSLFVCLSVCLFVCLSVCVFVCLSCFVLFCFVCLFLCLFIKLSFQVSLWRAANLYFVFSLAERRAETSASSSLRGAPSVAKSSPIESFQLWQVPGITTAPASTESSETF